jgi:hypothetical protein
MSPSWRNFIHLFRSTIPDGLHPAAATTIRYWFGAMEYAADRNDRAKVERLARMIERKVEQELEFERENAARVNPRLIRNRSNPR